MKANADDIDSRCNALVGPPGHDPVGSMLSRRWQAMVCNDNASSAGQVERTVRSLNQPRSFLRVQ